jgi:hypothetical protein
MIVDALVVLSLSPLSCLSMVVPLAVSMTVNTNHGTLRNKSHQSGIPGVTILCVCLEH